MNLQVGPPLGRPGDHIVSAMEFWVQSDFDVRLDWGPDGATRLASVCPVVVVVDVLRFTTVIDVAVSRAVTVLPLAEPIPDSDPISPSMAAEKAPGSTLRIFSPNGGLTCLAAAKSGARVLAACFRNAQATAAQLKSRPIGFVAAGERWRDWSLRPCWEDLCGVGAVIANLEAPVTLSPEAASAVAVFRSVENRIAEQLVECASGRELVGQGLAEDVRLAAMLNVSGVSSLVGGVFLRENG